MVLKFKAGEDSARNHYGTPLNDNDTYGHRDNEPMKGLI